MPTESPMNTQDYPSDNTTYRCLRAIQHSLLKVDVFVPKTSTFAQHELSRARVEVIEHHLRSTVQGDHVKYRAGVATRH